MKILGLEISKKKKDRRWLVTYKYQVNGVWLTETTEAHVDGGTDGDDLWSWYVFRRKHFNSMVILFAIEI